MNVAINKMVETSLASEGERPIVIIGSGPVGVRVAQNLLREIPNNISLSMAMNRGSRITVCSYRLSLLAK